MLFLILLLLGLCSKSLASFSYNEAESKRMLYYSAAVYCRDLLNAKKFSCASCGLAGVEGVEVKFTIVFSFLSKSKQILLFYLFFVFFCPYSGLQNLLVC